jgi:4'-phosphopantetheinyl transferase
MTGAIEIWSLNLAEVAPALFEIEAEVGLLNSADRAGIANSADPEVANTRLATLIALRALLCGIVGRSEAAGPFAREAHGKPRLSSRYDCHFNVSHSRGLVLIALSRLPVGVDIEQPRDVKIDPRRRGVIEAAACAVADGRPLPRVAGDLRFLQAWTRLEALAKAHGQGIGKLLTTIGAVGRAQLPEAVTQMPEDLRVLIRTFATRDLLLGRDSVAAFATPRTSLTEPVLRALPDTVWGLRRLIETTRTLGTI